MPTTVKEDNVSKRVGQLREITGCPHSFEALRPAMPHGLVNTLVANNAWRQPTAKIIDYAFLQEAQGYLSPEELATLKELTHRHWARCSNLG